MERRTFLKGAVVAASTPVVVFAPPMAQTLSNYIAQHREVWAMCKEATAIVDDMVIKGPDFPFILMGEVAREHARERRKFYDLSAIDKFFDDEEKSARWHIQNRITPTAHEARLVRLQAQRTAAHELLAAREREYRTWQDASGLTAAQDESDRLGDLEIKLDEKIMGWPIETLDEAKQVAGYLSQLHGDKIPKAELMRLVGALVA